MGRVHLLRCLVVSGLLLLVPISARAQVSTADLVGSVTDGSGSVLPGATVEAKHQGTNLTRVQVSNASGEFSFTLLPIGPYVVTATMSGFRTHTTEVTLTAGGRLRVDAALQIGAMSETVAVAAQSELLQTDSSTLSSLITSRFVQELPVPGRNFAVLAQLVPGANEGTPAAFASGSRPDDRRQTSAISINGALDNQNNNMIDGMDNNERQIGTIGVKPSIEAIAEMQVQTNMYTAESGRTAGGVINIITKSGTNDFRGSVFEFVRNDRFDVRDYFSTDKPRLRQHQFGGSLGGPVVRDRTFFFFDIEGLRNEAGVVNVLTVPTMRMRQGDFSELATTIHDPMSSSRVPFAGNVIPANRLDPIGLRYANLYPQPTSEGLSNNWSGTTLRSQKSVTADIRVDHRFSDSQSMFVRHSLNDVDTVVPGNCPATEDGIEPGCATFPQFPGPNTTNAYSTQVNYVKVFNPSLVAEVRAGYLKIDIRSNPLNFGRNVSEEWGLPGVNLDETTSGLVQATFAGYPTVGEPMFIPLWQINDTWQANMTVTKTTGRHTLKMGGGYIHRDFNVFQSNSPLGTNAFDTRPTNDGAGSGGNAMASLLLGLPSTRARVLSPFVPTYNTREVAGYFQDDWRATRWLTVNMGIRYDIFTPYTEAENRMSNFDLSLLQIVRAGVDTSRTAGIETYYKAFAPRLGLAATVADRTVVRGGFGLSYFPGNFAAGSLLKNPPFVSSFGPVTSDATIGQAPTLFLNEGMPLPVFADHLDVRGNVGGTAFDFKPTRVQQYNVAVEKDFGGNVVTVGYVGSYSDRLVGGVNYNQPAPGPGAVQARRPLVDLLPNAGNVTLSSTIYNAYYNALQLQFRRQYRGGLSFSTSYTLGKSEQTAAKPWAAFEIERFNRDNDVRHRVVAQATYELPYRSGNGGALDAVFADWQVNAVAVFNTGLPFNVTNATARANTGGGDRPNLVGDPDLSDRTIDRWFNTAAFEPQPINTIGDQVVPNNLLHGPNQKRIDFSLFKTLPLQGNVRLQLRAEIYNLFNVTNFGNPNGQLGSPNFGKISTTIGTPRQMQFAVKILF